MKLIDDSFQELKDPENNTKLGTNVYVKNNIFTGPNSAAGPDAVIGSWEETGFNIKRNYNNNEGSAYFGIDSNPLVSGTEWSGTHRINGIFLISGDYIKDAGELTGTGICDIFPTVLSIFNIPVPDGTDGKVLK